MQFSKELLADIHIRLDKEGLRGLDEIIVLHLWARVLVAGVWAVAASLIASLIFKACGVG